MTTDIQPLTYDEMASWYDKHCQLYGSYAQCIRFLLETLIKSQNLPYHSITCRTKERQSFLNKVTHKTYTSCEQITDFAGIRVIAFTTADVKHICELIEAEFQCDRENSVDKGREMQENQVGYLSVHYIISLDQHREDLAEYSHYKGLKCEIQVRTLLQHAWAEIEHDRNYKFGGVLPKDIRRRFYLVAGTLELMDREFQNLSDAIDDYALQVTQDAKQGNLNIPIDSISLSEFVRQRFPDLEPGQPLTEGSSEIVEELHDMDIQTLAQLDALLSPQFVQKIRSSGTFRTAAGVLRDAMIVHDSNKYFKSAWKEHWGATSPQSIELWREFGVDTAPILRRIHIWIDDDGVYDVLEENELKYDDET